MSVFQNGVGWTEPLSRTAAPIDVRDRPVPRRKILMHGEPVSMVECARRCLATRRSYGDFLALAAQIAAPPGSLRSTWSAVRKQLGYTKRSAGYRPARGFADLSEKARDYFSQCALARQEIASDLVQALLERIAADDLIDAILDEGKR